MFNIYCLRILQPDYNVMMAIAVIMDLLLSVKNTDRFDYDFTKPIFLHI